MKSLNDFEEEILGHIENDSKRMNDSIDQLLSVSEKALKYSRYYYNLKNHYDKISIEESKLYSKLHHNARYNNPYQIKTKSDIESFINSNDDYIKILKRKKKIESLKELVGSVRDIFMSKQYAENLIFKYKMGDVGLKL